LKVAVTAVAVLTVTAQEPVPEQAPAQPAKIESPSAVAVRVRAVPGATDREQAVPQLMPAGLLVTVPEPAPFLVTESVTRAGVVGRAGTESVTRAGVVPRAGTGTALQDWEALVWPTALIDWTQMKPTAAAPLA
jgi:hypothetical protein